ncbi:MAG: hypothetical protein JWP31_2723 [Aeromicrobium sp.]|nr:hypothetical protein [Aeromicrobium sp.]
MRFRWFVALGLVVAAVLAAATLRDRAPLRSEQCVADVNGVRAQVGLEQARWASLMAAVGQRRGLPPRATTIAIATAYQESKITNIDYGDRDSVGLFQQRPSQGWGTVEQIMSPQYSIGAFYDALVKLDGYETMNINDAAQRVQRSGFPQAYAQHERYARSLASSLRGYSPARFTCQINPEGGGSASAVVKDVERAFGDLEVTRSGGDLAYPLTGDGAGIRARGWAVAHYLVANASHLGISEVTFGGRAWTADDSDQGWTRRKAAATDTVSASTS